MDITEGSKTLQLICTEADICSQTHNIEWVGWGWGVGGLIRLC